MAIWWYLIFWYVQFGKMFSDWKKFQLNDIFDIVSNWGFDVKQLRQLYNDVSLRNLLMTTNNEFNFHYWGKHSIMVNCYLMKTQFYQINLITYLLFWCFFLSDCYLDYKTKWGGLLLFLLGAWSSRKSIHPIKILKLMFFDRKHIYSVFLFFFFVVKGQNDLALIFSCCYLLWVAIFFWL